MSRHVRSADLAFRGDAAGERFAILVGRHAAHGESAQHTLALVELAPGATSGEHFHAEREESDYLLEGAIEATIGGHEFRAAAGDLLSAKPGERHHFQNDGEKPARYLVITAAAWVPEDSHP